MQYRVLGESGLKVSHLCFGSLTLGALQRNYSTEYGASLIRHALENGVNFIDTAELYETYSHIKAALRKWPGEVVVCTKTYAYSRDQAARSVEEARKKLDREVIDIFLLHEQESRLTLEGHRPALEYLVECREKGIIKAAGVSTHYQEVVRAAASMEEVQVIHPLLNKPGIGIRDGSAGDMINAIEMAKKKGKGIFIMKPLAGGHLVNLAEEALSFARDFSLADAVAVGMGSKAEVEYAVALFGNKEVPESLKQEAGNRKRKLFYLKEDCSFCMNCVQACPQDAVSWDNGPVIDHSRCILCGYCGAYCSSFCLRIV